MIPPFEDVVRSQRRAARNRALGLTAVGVILVLAVVTAMSLIGRTSARTLPAVPRPTTVDGPAWRAEDVVGHPDAFVAWQTESARNRQLTLTVWKRCFDPAPDDDCVGREAIALSDGRGQRQLVLSVVTGSSSDPSGDPGVLREVDDGIWYWAHLGPGPLLLSTDWPAPVPVTVMDRPVAARYGTATVECADGAGLCVLDLSGRTLQRIALPQLESLRWAQPTTCGFWGLAGSGKDVRLLIQQPDDSFVTVGLPDKAPATMMAEGGGNCEIAVYQFLSDNRVQVYVSLDRGRTWQVRRAPLPQEAGLYQEYPHLRVLLSHEWAGWPETTSPIGMPGTPKPL